MSRFQPFAHNFDEGRALAVLKAATNGADDGELYLERRRSEALMFDDGRIKTANYDASEGFGLRAVKAETAGYAHATELSEAALKRAAETVTLAIGHGGGTLAIPPRDTNVRLYTDSDPMEDAPFSGKVDLLGEIDAYARARDPRVVQVSASLTASMQEIEILRPDGTRRADRRPLTRLNVSIIVEHKGRRETGTAGGGGRHGLTQLKQENFWQGLADEALRIAVVNLGAVDAPAGVMDGGAWSRLARHSPARGCGSWS